MSDRDRDDLQEVAVVNTDGAYVVDSEVEQLRRRVAELERTLARCEARYEAKLDLAAKVHRSLLPPPVKHPEMHIDVRYIPIEAVGGDYCQVHFPDRDSCVIAVCDVTGHGVGPALLATRVSSEVRHNILYGRPPCEIVQSINEFVHDNFTSTNLYLTFLVARIDFAAGCVTWSGGGHPPPLLVHRRTGQVEPLVSQNLLLGVLREGLLNEPEDVTEIEPGDRIVFYTDGLNETVDEYEQQLGVQGLQKIVVDAMEVDLFDAADFILDRVFQFQHGPTTDDMTLIVAERQ